MSGKLKLALSCWDYDRTRALADGTVQPDGIDLVYHSLPVEETFFRMLRYREFDLRPPWPRNLLQLQPQPDLDLQLGSRRSRLLRRLDGRQRCAIRCQHPSRCC